MSDPVKYQFADKVAGLFGSSRYWIGHGGRGGLKSWSAARAALLQAAERPLRVLCAREVQKSIKDSVHQLLCDQIKLLGLEGFYNTTRDEITAPNGSKFIFSGLSDQTAASIKSFEGIDLCWVEEAFNVTRKSWDILVPTIRKPGSRIWLTFNPELDTDETWVRFVESPPADAEVVQLTYRDNPWFPAVLDQERREFLRQVELGVRSKDDYDNIWEGKCRSAVVGAIYAHEVGELQRTGRHCPVPYDPLLPVHCVWDLGWNDSMVVGMWQRSPMGLMLIDSLITSHTKYSDIVTTLDARKYRFGKDFLPHDGKHKNPQTGQSAEYLLGQLGRKTAEVPSVGLEAGIKATRQQFSRLWIARDVGDNKAVLNGLKRYKRAVSTTTNEPGAPLHDDASHPSDMVRYAVLSADEMVDAPIIKDPYAAFARRAG